jgi:hypothetical protein
MRRFLTAFTLIAFFSEWLRADVYKEQHTGIEFPETIGSYKRGKIAPYAAEPKKSGVAIEYRSDDAEVTVYVRASGQEGAKTSADYLKESLAAIKTLEAQGKYSNVKIYEFSAEKEKPGWKSAAFTSSSTNRFIVSFIYCKVASEHLVKIRATTGNPTNDPLQSFTKPSRRCG